MPAMMTLMAKPAAHEAPPFLVTMGMAMRMIVPVTMLMEFSHLSFSFVMFDMI